MSSKRPVSPRPILRANVCVTLVVLAFVGCTTAPEVVQPTAVEAEVRPPPAETEPATVEVAVVDPRALEEAAEQEARAAEEAALAFARAVLDSEGARKLDADQRESVAQALTAAETEHGFDVLLLLAIMQLESRFDPNARGPAGSIGLMQLQPATARAVAKRSGVEWNGEKTLRDPETNARLGLAYLAELRARFGSMEHAIAAYNIGPSKLRRLLARRPLGRGPYLTKVFANVDSLRAEYGELAAAE